MSISKAEKEYILTREFKGTQTLAVKATSAIEAKNLISQFEYTENDFIECTDLTIHWYGKPKVEGPAPDGTNPQK